MDNSPVKHFLLKFNVTGVNGQTITNAKIRLYNVDAASAGGNFYHVSDDSWQEGTVKWNNAPAADTTLLASLGAVSVDTWYEVDITSLITGNGTYSLRITDSIGGADYSSKEGANPPQLVIKFETASNRYTVSNSDENAYGYRHFDSNGNRYEDFYRNAYFHTYFDSNPNSNCRCYLNANLHSHANFYTHLHTHIHTDPNANPIGSYHHQLHLRSAQPPYRSRLLHWRYLSLHL